MKDNKEIAKELMIAAMEEIFGDFEEEAIERVESGDTEYCIKRFEKILNKHHSDNENT